MLCPEFSLKSILWLMAVVAIVLTGWAMIDLVGAAAESGDVSYSRLLWMGGAYVVAFTTLLATRDKL